MKNHFYHFFFLGKCEKFRYAEILKEYSVDNASQELLQLEGIYCNCDRVNMSRTKNICSPSQFIYHMEVFLNLYLVELDVAEHTNFICNKNLHGKIFVFCRVVKVSIVIEIGGGGGGGRRIWGKCSGTFMISRPTLSCSHW